MINRLKVVLYTTPTEFIEVSITQAEYDAFISAYRNKSLYVFSLPVGCKLVRLEDIMSVDIGT